MALERRKREVPTVERPGIEVAVTDATGHSFEGIINTTEYHWMGTVEIIGSIHNPYDAMVLQRMQQKGRL